MTYVVMACTGMALCQTVPLWLMQLWPYVVMAHLVDGWLDLRITVMAYAVMALRSYGPPRRRLAGPSDNRYGLCSYGPT